MAKSEERSRRQGDCEIGELGIVWLGAVVDINAKPGTLGDGDQHSMHKALVSLLIPLAGGGSVLSAVEDGRFEKTTT